MAQGGRWRTQKRKGDSHSADTKKIPPSHPKKNITRSCVLAETAPGQARTRRKDAKAVPAPPYLLALAGDTCHSWWWWRERWFYFFTPLLTDVACPCPPFASLRLPWSSGHAELKENTHCLSQNEDFFAPPSQGITLAAQNVLERRDEVSRYTSRRRVGPSKTARTWTVTMGRDGGCWYR